MASHLTALAMTRYEGPPCESTSTQQPRTAPPTIAKWDQYPRKTNMVHNNRQMSQSSPLQHRIHQSVPTKARSPPNTTTAILHGRVDAYLRPKATRACSFLFCARIKYHEKNCRGAVCRAASIRSTPECRLIPFESALQLLYSL